MNKILRALGWIIGTLGALSFLCAPITIMDSTKDSGATFGFLMFGFVFGLPGGLLLWRTSKSEKESSFRTQFIGFLRTHDRFTVAEMAQKIGRTELETEQLIVECASQAGLDLVFHRADRTYLHRNRIRGAFRVVERCGACGATDGNEVGLEGEPILCRYCGSPVEQQA